MVLVEPFAFGVGGCVVVEDKDWFGGEAVWVGRVVVCECVVLVVSVCVCCGVSMNELIMRYARRAKTIPYILYVYYLRVLN